MRCSGEMVSDRDGVVTLVWDNTYSLITSRQVVGRIAVKRGGEGCGVMCRSREGGRSEGGGEGRGSEIGRGGSEKA